MKSIFLRYFTTVAFVILISFSVLSTTFIYLSTGEFVNRRTEIYERVAVEIAENVPMSYTDGKWTVDDSFRRVLPAFQGSLDASIIICDIDGVVLDSSNSASEPFIGQSVDLSLLKNSDSRNNTVVAKYPDDNGQLRNVVSREISRSGIQTGTVIVTPSLMKSQDLSDGFVRVFLFVSLIVFFVSFGMAYATSRSMTRPLRDMAACANSFAHGDFSARVNRWVDRGDEVGELACSFNAMADELNKAEELRRGFIANVSHELKTPMTNIAGYIGGLSDGTIPPERRDETLSIVLEEMWRLSRMVSSMVELSRLQSGQVVPNPKIFDICELSMRVMLGFESKINEKNLGVSINLPEEEPINVTADPDLIVQVVTNLLDNAVKFSDTGGELTISIFRRGVKAYVCIKNTGSVIDPEELPYIFDRYHKADRSRSRDRTGLGLGLYLVHSFINAHRESIHVTSEAGVTEFTFSLPVVKGNS